MIKIIPAWNTLVEASFLGASYPYGILTEGLFTAPGTTINGYVGYTTLSGGITVNGSTTVANAAYYAALDDKNAAKVLIDAEICDYSNGAAVDLHNDATHYTAPAAQGSLNVYFPGVYCITGAMAISGPITLSGEGIYIFRTPAAFNVAAGLTITLANGARAEDIFWRASASTIGANTFFKGTILDNGSITTGASTVVEGRFFGTAITAPGNTINAPVSTSISSLGAQQNLRVGTTSATVGGSFSIVENATMRDITEITITENGTTDAQNDLDNIKLFYEMDTSVPYDCSGLTHDGSESQFGATDTDGFSGANGTSTFSGSSVNISTTSAMCIYVVTDVLDTATFDDTIQIEISEPTIDVIGSDYPTIGPSSAVVLPGTTTIEQVIITQANYHWRNDDGNETDGGATSATGGTENTAYPTFPKNVTQRLRFAVSNDGNVTSDALQYRLEYAEKITTCSDASGWTDVGAVGGDFDMSNSINLTDGADTTSGVSVANGGVSDPNTSFLTPNAGIRDTTSQTDDITLAATDFVELEYAIRASSTVPNDSAYCMRLTAAGTPIDVYTNYPELTVIDDVLVDILGSQAATVVVPTAGAYAGGVFRFTDRTTGAASIIGLTITASGTADIQNDISNIKLRYDLDTSSPYTCDDESYSNTDAQFGSTVANFSPSSQAVFTDAVSNSPTQTVCIYVEYDVTSDVASAETLEISIVDPSTEVVIIDSFVTPNSALDIPGTTVALAPSLTQANYHWRNDDGNETGATSATGDTENTGVNNIYQGTQQRLRFAVSNNGNASALTTGLRLEYGTKVTSCENVGSWQRVDTGVAFVMDTASQLVQGDDSTNILEAVGGVSNPNTTFLSPNAAQLETVDQLAALTITDNEFVEIEYALELTTESAFSTTYCFRLTDAGAAFPVYTNYPELEVQDRQDFLVQRGNAVVSGTGITLTAGVDYKAPTTNTRAYVRITDTNMTGAGSITLGAPSNPDDLSAYIEGADDLVTSFSIVRPPSATGNTRVQWEIVEYVGVAGGDNEFIVRDAGEVTYGASSLSVTGTAVTGVSTDSDVAVFITGQYNPATAVGDYNTGLSVSSWDATDNRPIFERGDADGVAARTSYAVVEFVGRNWGVQRAEHTFTNAGVVETESITAVNSLLRTFIHPQKLSGNELSGLADSGHEVWLSSIGAVSFQLEGDASTPAQQRSVVWVLENTQLGIGSMSVYRSNGTIAQTSTQPNAYLFSIGATVEPANASIVATTRSTGGSSTEHPRAQLGARVFDATQFELWKSDEGENQNFRVEVIEWPVAETSIRQMQYRFYVDNDALTPTDPWPLGASNLGENTAITDGDEPLGEGERTRIRLGLYINNASFVAESTSFKLQYALRFTTCSAIGSWTDVDAVGADGVWRAHDGSPVGGTELTDGGSLLLSTSNVSGTYEEDSPSVDNPNGAEVGDYVEYDWLIEHNAAIQQSSYCFRMVEDDGTLLDGYEVYPTVRTASYTPVITNWRWYDDEVSLTPTVPLAGEGVAPSVIANGEVMKLRVAVTEIEGAPGENIKFNLQYSEYPDFRDGVTLTATTSCEGNSLWCYADGAGSDNETLDTALLSGGDACMSGVGDGCGSVNESSGVSGTYNQPVYTTSEHEFTLRHDGARVNAVYYFRLVDATNGVNVTASSSYPSLSTEGAILTFTVSGIDAATAVEGITTDITTTATRIDFGSLPMDTDTEAAQRLTVFTNGTEGYRVYMDVSHDMINSYGDSIPSLASTNAAPATWESQCLSTMTGCFGYHVGDNILYDGSVRFGVDNSYSGIEPGLVEIMSSNIPVTYDMSEIVYRTRVGILQPAGDYTTSVRYIIVPIF